MGLRILYALMVGLSVVAVPGILVVVYKMIGELYGPEPAMAYLVIVAMTLIRTVAANSNNKQINT